jgi:O-acetylhomoserine (thiol)-lyase
MTIPLYSFTQCYSTINKNIFKRLIIMNKETQALHYGYTKDTQGTMAVPIYQTTAYEFEDANLAAELFALKKLGNIYTRLSNPTTDVFESRVTVLEGGASGVATASGQSAIFYAITNLAKSGDNIIISNKLYGGSVTLTTHTLKRFGINTKIFDIDNPRELDKLIDDNTKAIFFESLSNPQVSIAPVDEITKIAQKHGIITICDNTVATPILFNPISHGVDIVVHSASKYITGQGLAIGGIIVDRDGLNEFFKSSSRYSCFNTPDESYHGLVYSDLPFPAFNMRVRLSLLRDIGAVLSPHSSWLFIQGIETLSLRMQKHSQNALEVAKFLESHHKVKMVNYPALSSNSQYAKAQKYFKDGYASGLLSFIVGSYDEALSIMDKTKLFSIVVNIGDSKSIITHPASTTHQQLSKEELLASGVDEGLIRLSIGLENVEDLINDLQNALNG